jgi:hypothetical protein
MQIRMALLAVVAITPCAIADISFVNLHPSGASASYCHAVDGGRQVGESVVGLDGVASLWAGSAGSWMGLNPVGVTSAVAWDVVGTQHAGQVNPGAARATLWSGGTLIDLHPASGASSSQVYGLSATHQAGYIRVGTTNRASVWSGTSASRVDLHPTGATRSQAFGVDAGQQVGYAIIAGSTRASLWTGNSGSWTDLTPGVAVGGEALAVDAGQQVGHVVIGTLQHASLWTGTVGSWVDLNPAGADNSDAMDVSAGFQAGSATVAGLPHASLWNGTAASWVDLHAALPTDFLYSVAEGVWSDGTTVTVGGWGYNNTTQRDEALLWTYAVPAPGAAGLLACGLMMAGRRRRVGRGDCSRQRLGL